MQLQLRPRTAPRLNGNLRLQNRILALATSAGTAAMAAPAGRGVREGLG